MMPATMQASSGVYFTVQVEDGRVVGYETQSHDWLWYHAERIRKVDNGERARAAFEEGVKFGLLR